MDCIAAVSGATRFLLFDLVAYAASVVKSGDC